MFPNNYVTSIEREGDRFQVKYDPEAIAVNTNTKKVHACYYRPTTGFYYTVCGAPFFDHVDIVDKNEYNGPTKVTCKNCLSVMGEYDKSSDWRTPTFTPDGFFKNPNNDCRKYYAVVLDERSVRENKREFVFGWFDVEYDVGKFLVRWHQIDRIKNRSDVIKIQPNYQHYMTPKALSEFMDIKLEDDIMEKMVFSAWATKMWFSPHSFMNDEG